MNKVCVTAYVISIRNRVQLCSLVVFVDIEISEFNELGIRRQGH